MDMYSGCEAIGRQTFVDCETRGTKGEVLGIKFREVATCPLPGLNLTWGVHCWHLLPQTPCFICLVGWQTGKDGSELETGEEKFLS